MRISKYLLANLREVPADADTASHQLMLRAGMVRKIASGIYAWLPMGLRTLRKIEAIIRQEMDKTGAQELLMPNVQPAELWQESQRWDQYGPELLRFSDRSKRKFCLGPTHEEIITALMRREIKSYKQLPANFYQIQTKFRDEIRPRFGIIRAREFIMKDAYSFHMTDESLQTTYQQMFQTYSTILQRLGLQFHAVQADSGNIGGSTSHEFHILANIGEDQIVFSDKGNYASNIELVDAPIPTGTRPLPKENMQIVDTPNQYSIADISQFLDVAKAQCLKTLIVNGHNKTLVALILRGDHELNRVKVEKCPLVAQPLEFASAEQIKAELNCSVGSVGPHGLNIPILVDHDALHVADFICGANENDKHLTGVNWDRDIPEPAGVDIRNVIKNEPAPDGGKFDIARSIEVGHIFQLGTKYSKLMNATCIDSNGHPQALAMGCYGIGVSRLVAATIEQNHDDHGIIWPTVIAPFCVSLIPINMHKSQRLNKAVMELYYKLEDAAIETLLDDRKERPGVMFADAELIGIPHHLIFSERGLDANTIEYRSRHDRKNTDINLSEVVGFIKQLITSSTQ